MIADVRSQDSLLAAYSARCRAWLDGVEVTTDCFYADDQAGIVRCYVRNAQGHLYLDPRTNEPAWTERRGHVVIWAPPD